MSKKPKHDDADEASETEEVETDEQPDLDISTAAPTGPVECLGMTFPSDAARRAHFLKELANKLKDPAFRKIEGFPIGEDEDILALSDPPYYTACPNPWLADFVKHYGKPYDPKDKYHREPFAADVSEGKNHPIYNAHSYPTKVPHRAIMRYILHYTEPGDILFDGFCGTGMTGVAAELCGDQAEVQSLGYSLAGNRQILDESRTRVSSLGARRALLLDLAPAASFIAANYNTPVAPSRVRRAVDSILAHLARDLGWMYETRHSTGKMIGHINYTVWSDIFTCPECGGRVTFWKESVDLKRGEAKTEFPCPHCSVSLTKRKLEQFYETKHDPATGRTLRIALQEPVLINYSVGTKRWEKVPDDEDLHRIARSAQLAGRASFPTDALPDGFNLRQPKESHGFVHAHLFYTPRTLAAVHAFRSLWPPDLRRTLDFVLGSILPKLTKLNRYMRQHGSRALVGPMANALYVPPISVENNVFDQIAFQVKKILQAIPKGRTSVIGTASATNVPLPPSSVDYVFVDPPFGANIMYSDMLFLRESWLRVRTNTEHEAIENSFQKKSIDDYRLLMGRCFAEAFRLLKPGRWMTVEFSNTQAAVWNALQTTLQEAGFVIASVAALDKTRGGFHAMTSPTAVKQDLVISAYKPNGGLEDRFAKRGDSEEGLWDFIRTHLGNLAIVRPKGGKIDPIPERDARILFDRAVAFYVRHGLPVPISAPEFQTGLAEKFPERDGMYFLPDQAADYDKVRMKMEGIGQLTIFVEDERSAVDWLRNYLKNKPSKYQDIQPEFFEQLNQSWKKWETRPELRALLDQYFLCYQGEGDVPPQIHGHLSTNFKELRTLPADHAMLRAKARDRWFVPDPRKNADVEQLREKRLLEEFWSYLPPGYEAAARARKPGEPMLPGIQRPPPRLPKGRRIAIVRTEAVRVGFNFCFARNDYATIIAVAQHIPDDVIHNDEQLQMIYDSAVTRTGGETE
jgi:DNA modification methylase